METTEQELTTHRIACVRMDSSCYEHDPIITHITEWTDVDDKTFKLLKKAEHDWELGEALGGEFQVIEFLPPRFIGETVEKYVELIRKREEELAIKKQKQAERNLLRKQKKELRDAQTKAERLEKLKREIAELEQN